jgi:hypothetical protein
LSHKPRPIKVANTALNQTTKADEIAIKTAKTGEVTAVVAVMSIFSRKRWELRNTNLRNEKPSHQKVIGGKKGGEEGKTKGCRGHWLVGRIGGQSIVSLFFVFLGGIDHPICLETPLDVLFSVHSYRTEVLVGMGNYYILVIANFLENPSLELS